MDSRYFNIAMLEPSVIIVEGLTNIIMSSGVPMKVFHYDDLEEASMRAGEDDVSLIIINPVQVQNRIKQYKMVVKNSHIKFIALVYNYFDSEILSLFDSIIRISDDPVQILQVIEKAIGETGAELEHARQEYLSERENEVLISLVNGLSNKEIADKLFISIHTVISHRKNITKKTGIKSQSGLTIYALSNNLISLENLS
jgi:DNA-binding NarL/FixJ family response regulator